ncbi:MAG: peptidoglycan-binding protein, partial [Pseudorhodobacter sp.]
MQLSKRTTLAGLGALILTGCVGGGGGAVAARTTSQYRPVPNAGFDAWVASFRARTSGISAT